MTTLCLLAAVVAASLPNPSFEQGDELPTGWRLEGKGTWEKTGHSGNRSVSVVGTGEDSGFWRTADWPLQPNSLYRVSFWTTAEKIGNGCVISGPNFCNRDFRLAEGWQQHSFVFVSPADVGDAFVRLGHWSAAGKVRFDDVRVVPTQAVHARYGDLELGEGETINGKRYEFRAPFDAEGANYSRPLHSFRCGFNSQRWTFHGEAEVVYRHALPGFQQTAATIEINCGYHTSGAGIVEAGKDGKTWTEIARFQKTGTVRAELPADAGYIRIRTDGKSANFQINEYRYTAALAADAGRKVGTTVYPDVALGNDEFPVTIQRIPSPDESAGECRLEVGNKTDRRVRCDVSVTVTDTSGESETSRASIKVSSGDSVVLTVPCNLRRSGSNVIAITGRVAGNEVYRATLNRFVPILYEAAYGYALPSREPCALWWCEGTYKVSQTRPVPIDRRREITLAAARNEYEPVQLVLRPAKELRNLRVTTTSLGAATIRVDQVAYLEVARPTDAIGVAGWWPDPMPPFEQGATLEAGRNHPLWLTVYVPPDQPPGEYKGSIALSADGWKANVPVRLRVWDFALPKESHLQTGFGLSPHLIRRYHNLETTEELRQVLDLYLESFAAHRIAPYTPAPLDPYRVEFATGPWDGGTRDAADPHGGKYCLRIEDRDARSSVAAGNAKLITVETDKSYQLSWWARMAQADQPYLVTLQQYDAAGNWISGNNMDFNRTGTGAWKREEIAVPKFNPRTKFVRVALRPAPWSQAGEATGVAWFDDVRFEAIPPGGNLLVDGDFEQGARDLAVRIDFTAYDREGEKWLDRYGFNALNVSLRGLGGGTFHERYPGRVGGFEQGTSEYEQLMASQGKQLVDHLRQKGWLDKAYIYWFDEPDKKDYEFVADTMKLIKRVAPGLTRMLTEQPEPELFGHVDLWCPVVSAVDTKTIAERRRAGERFWWYLCCGPHAPYIGLFIDHPAVDLRVWAWLSRKWGVSGQLVWESNYWTSTAAFPGPEIENPWQDPMSYVSGYSYKPGQIGYWGNGDGRFLYPPNRDVNRDKTKYLSGPISSLRWEMLREGIEDYEYFVLLDQRIAAAKARDLSSSLIAEAEQLALVPDGIIKDDKIYSQDPEPLHDHRRMVAEMIERLGRALR